MSETFGRRRPAPYPAAAVAAEPPSETPAGWKPMVDPEFEAWDRARTRTRWKTWGLCGLIALGGPMSLLMPAGVGQWAGVGLTIVGGAGFLGRFRKPPQAVADPQ